MDDILVRLKRAKTHLADLEKTFGNIRRAGLRLKAKKCAFGVQRLNKGVAALSRFLPRGVDQLRPFFSS